MARRRRKSRNSRKRSVKDRSSRRLSKNKKKIVQITSDKSVGEIRAPSLSGPLVKEVVKSVQHFQDKAIKSSHNVMTKGRRGSKLRTNSIEMDLSEIPKTGSRLLEWVRKHMGYEVDDDEPSEEEIIPEKAKKKKVSEPISDEEKKKEEKPIVQPAKEEKRLYLFYFYKEKEKAPSEQVVVKLSRPPDIEDEIMKLIKKKKQEAQALLSSKTPIKHEDMSSTKEEKGQTKRKKKKKKKKRSPKRKSKKEKSKMSADQGKAEAISPKMLEKLKLEEEAEKAEILAAEQRAEAEQVIRMQAIRAALDTIKFNNDYNRKMQIKEIQDNYWKLYVECGDLPIVNHIADMTMYLDSWRNVIDETTPEEAAGRTRDVIKLLRVLTDFIDNKPPKSERRLENFKWLREIFRQQLEEMMEKMTFKILRDITTNMHAIDLETGDFNYKDDRFILCLWLKFQLPKPLFNPRKPPPPPISLNLEPLNMGLDFPTTITGEEMVVRVLYLTFDHLSDTSRSFLKPPKPEYYNYNLYDVLDNEWRVKKKYKVLGRYRALYELEIQKHEAHQQEKINYKPSSMTAPPPDLPPLPKFKLPEIDSKGVIPEVPPMKFDPTPEEYAETLEEVNMTAMKANMLYKPEEFEINLRKYIILGGMHIINLYYQPPQPQHLVTMVLNLTSFILPKKIETVPFYESYTAPPPSTEQKTPEELESLIKLQEEAFEKLLLITLT
ncbi:hypothetical protein WA026_005139 [Henosepilachna vigintioctopunctata]|uniref:IC97/Casc1 N-terminal domain-containing protein n=1 Tax=Henosepilachna vigintioctopunctata TaxID=420089 RepID=A0AAW1UKQ8_9CUCU